MKTLTNDKILFSIYIVISFFFYIYKKIKILNLKFIFKLSSNNYIEKSNIILKI